MIIIKESNLVKVVEYKLVFEWNDLPGAGFSFPCDKQGNILFEEMPQPARKNLAFCQNGEYAVRLDGIQDYSYTYREPASGQCSCDLIVELSDPMTNPCECGLEYNGGGQLLAPRSQWEETWDADSTFDIWD